MTRNAVPRVTCRLVAISRRETGPFFASAGRVGRALMLTALVCTQGLAAGVPAAAEQSATSGARAVRWTAEADLRAFFADAARVKQFFNEIANQGDRSAADWFGDLYEFRIVDLDRDGWLELVALASGTGRKVATYLLTAFPRRPGAEPPDRLATMFDGFVMRELTGFAVGDLHTVLRDLDEDGRYEVVLPQLFGEFQGMARPNATMPEIYSWQVTNYSNVSARYPRFYGEEVLPRLERELRQLEALPPPNAKAERDQRRARRDVCLREIAEARQRAK